MAGATSLATKGAAPRHKPQIPSLLAYTALLAITDGLLEVNDSAVQVLGDDTLRLIARELVATVRCNVTID